MKRKIAIVLLPLAFLGCAATVIPQQRKRVTSFANGYVGKSVDVFMEDHPSAEVVVLDIAQNKFRYSLRHSVPCSFEEALLAPSDAQNVCWIDIYFFSEDGIIKRYSLQRGSLY